MGNKCCQAAPPGSGTKKKKKRKEATPTIVKPLVFTYFHQLGVSQPGTHKHHTVVQVGQTLSNGGLSQRRDTTTSAPQGQASAAGPAHHVWRPSRKSKGTDFLLGGGTYRLIVRDSKGFKRSAYPFKRSR